MSYEQLPPARHAYGCAGELLCREGASAEVAGFDSFPLTRLKTIHIARHLEALRRMIFIRLCAVCKMESVGDSLIAGLLQQIRSPQGRGDVPVEPPGSKHARRQIVRPPGYGDENGFVRGRRNQLNVTVEKVSIRKMIDPRA